MVSFDFIMTIQTILMIAGKGQIGNGNRRHNKGCNCKRSGCLKNYCECYEVCIVLTVWKITVNVVRYVSFWLSEKLLWMLWGMYHSSCLKNYCECYEVYNVLVVWKITVNVMRYVSFWLCEKIMWMLWGMYRSGCLKNYCECYEVCIVLAVWKINVNVMRYVSF
jgi:hypothetical protein